jgi:hypothetical protein
MEAFKHFSCRAHNKALPVPRSLFEPLLRIQLPKDPFP